MAATHPRDVFLLTDTLPAAEYREKLMGALVSRPAYPHYSYRPIDPIPIKAVPGMDPTPVTIRDIQQIVNTTSSAQFRAKLQGLITGYFGKDKSSSTENTAQVALKYSMDRPPDQLRALLSKKDVFNKVLELYETENTDKLYFVTYIVTLANWKVKKSDKVGNEGGMDIRVSEPNSQLNVQIGGSHKAVAENTVTGEYENEMIFCIGYHTVTLEKRKGPMAYLKRLSPSSKRSGYVSTPHLLSHADLKLDPVRTPGDGHLGMGPAKAGETPEGDPNEVAAQAAADKARQEVGFQIRDFPEQILPAS